MREIKFRAFVKPTKYMHEELAGKMFPADSIEWDYQGKGHLVYVGVYDGKENWEVKSANCELMQYTGLKDVNGVEIYEGDILERTVGGDSVWLVDYDEGSFFASGAISFPEKPWKYQVVGNKFENPELLKEEEG